MNRNWEDILPMFPFSSEVAATLQGEQTAMTPYLELAIAAERFDVEKIEEYRQAVWSVERGDFRAFQQSEPMGEDA